MGANTAVLVTVVLGVVLGLVVRRWIAYPARVESSSMEPTLRPGQHMAVRRAREGHQVARGDVVLVRSEELDRVVVKRVIGVGGEVLDLDVEGRVHVDGRLLVEPCVRQVPGPTRRYLVPDGHLFLLGDHRAVSSDSRSWRQPYLPDDAVVGRVIRFSARKECSDGTTVRPAGRRRR